VRRAPLAGLRVIAVEQFGAGPFATLHLADMGADVIKIEDPHTGGDVGRYVPPGQRDDQSLYFETFNRGKRSITLDLKHPLGRVALERLVAHAHVVFNNLRGDQAERLGLTYQHVQDVNPAIVCASLSGYGRMGPRAAEPGYDPLVQAEAGWAMLTGEPDGPPVRSGLPMADYAAGLTCALAIMIALRDVDRTGRGGDVDTSLYDVATAMLTYPATWYLSRGLVTERRAMSAHPSIVPFQFFETLDGYIAIACAKEKFFRELVVAMDLPELASDHHFATMEDRWVNREALLRTLTQRFRERSTDEWISTLRGKVPVAPVRSLTDAVQWEELEERGTLVQYSHPVFGEVQTVAPGFRMGDFHPIYRCSPKLGNDTDDVLREIGLDNEEIQSLRRSGALGSSPT
jgi:crotonobetainyl-CoA:carnitine CoA-transferase CaiB-like acyl-CoA transferase